MCFDILVLISLFVTIFLLQSVETSSKIYLINCLSAIQEPLIGEEVAASYVSNLCSAIEKHISILVDDEVDAILRRCGLLNKMMYIQDSADSAVSSTNDEPRPLAEIEEMSPQVLSECLTAFFGLVTGSEGSLPEFELLQVPRLRLDACSRVARALAGTYDLIYQAVSDPKNHYPDPRSLVKHSPDHIRTMLEI